jgi:prepilin-type N-terminal cleavage/methylation domain-containing protein
MNHLKKGFTLIELMISIMILSIMMIFLYKSYSSLNSSNTILKKELENITDIQKIKKTMILDISLALHNSIKIQNREKNEDVLFFQTSNSLHKRYNPFIVYIVRDKKLYRIESLKNIDDYTFPVDSDFDADMLGEVDTFRIYKSLNKTKKIYLVDMRLKKMQNILLKLRVLNEY